MIRPLNSNEVINLATTRRNKEIRNYFIFTRQAMNVSPEFKKGMKPNGSFYVIEESINEFPAVAAGLLKDKEQEWIIVGFEKDRKVNLIWLIEGCPRSELLSYLKLSDILQMAEKEELSSVLVFHNHPNSESNDDSKNPSDQDKKTAEHLADELNKNDINLIEFICENGRYHRYYLALADGFESIDKHSSKIEGINGKSRLVNIMLHYERLTSNFLRRFERDL